METDKLSMNMETNMTTEKALDILERHNLWRRGADYVEATDPRLLGIALDKAIELLRLSNVSDTNKKFTCPCCGSNKTYKTEAYYCKRCAITTEV